MRYALLICAGLLLAGCAQDTIRLSCTSNPAGATISYRVVSDAAPFKPITSWKVIGTTPFTGEVLMDSSWSRPGSVLQLKLDRTGYRPHLPVYSPSAILTDGRTLTTDNFVLETTPAPKPGPESGPRKGGSGP